MKIKILLLLLITTVSYAAIINRGGGSGAATSPGGADTQVQFNNAGLFGGTDTFTYNNATNVLTVGSDPANYTFTLNPQSGIFSGVQAIIGPVDDSLNLGPVADFDMNLVIDGGANLNITTDANDTNNQWVYTSSGSLNLVPLTTTERNDIVPPEGALIYNVTTHTVQVSTAANTTSWVNLN